MSTHSLPSQTFHNPPALDLGAALRKLLAGWSKALSRASNEAPVSESQKLRDYAATLMDRDPRFAADLFAAANRHERLHEL